MQKFTNIFLATGEKQSLIVLMLGIGMSINFMRIWSYESNSDDMEILKIHGHYAKLLPIMWKVERFLRYNAIFTLLNSQEFIIPKDFLMIPKGLPAKKVLGERLCERSALKVHSVVRSISISIYPISISI